uniref:Uncharacterized protein n=1 Tax=Candidatus Kentrum sp. DK TaxID=2126562 RepID=A0A450TLT9_9GAMM|nr:MAG: hypothetical protein BECKDK2373C_GA0170839_11915 [Candidatus Kentron sp. DK]
MNKKYKVKVDEKSYDVEIQENDTVDFDYKSYEKSLSNILEQAQKEFWSVCIDFSRYQIIVGKNNLWVAAALIGAYAALYNRFHSNIDLASMVGVLFCISFGFAIVSFGLCLYGMPLRNGYGFPYERNWSEFSEQAYERLENGAANSYITYLTNAIKKTDEASTSNRAANSSRAKIFRWTSYLLISSLLLSITSVFLFIIDVSLKDECSYLLTNTKTYVRCIMSNETPKQDTQKKPDVPKPERPAVKPKSTSNTSRMFLDDSVSSLPETGKTETKRDSNSK